jgi:2-methylcitrate dehydratase PrpD
MSSDLQRMQLGALNALGSALANAADTGIDIGVAAVLGGSYPIGEPITPFPCRRETHGYIEAIYMLREETSLHDDEVVSIVCAVSKTTLAEVCEPRAEKIAPQTRYDAANSLPYCVAASLILNKINRSSFTEGTIHNPRIQALMQKVSCVVDTDMSPDKSRITVERTRGKPVECTVTVPLGDPNNEMTTDQVYAKFRDDMTYAGHGAIADAAIAIVERMATSSDTAGLKELLLKAGSDRE